MQKLIPILTAVVISSFFLQAQEVPTEGEAPPGNNGTATEPVIQTQAEPESGGVDIQGPVAIEVEVPEIKVESSKEPAPAKEEEKPAPAPNTPEPAPAPEPKEGVPAPTEPAPRDMKPEPVPQEPAPVTAEMKPAAPQQPGEPSPVPAPEEPKPATTTTTEAAPNAEAVEEGRGTRDQAAAAEEKKMEVQAQEIRTEVKAEAAAAAKSNDPEKAKDVVSRILGVAGVAAGISANVQANRNRKEIQRINAERVGRTEREREESVDYLVQRFRGEQVQDVPEAYRSRYDQRGRVDSRDQRDPRGGVPPHVRDQRGGRRGFDGHRHVRYQNQSEVPAILLASSALNRVEITTVQDASRRNPNPPQSRFPRAEPIPQAYQAPTAVDLSYKVDAASEITQDDILFLQGSTAFADDYSNDIVLDLAYAMQDPSLGNMSFVVEGHASAEGSYELNLDLSQRRAERIVREMVRAGVSPHRLIPVGYGESEAYYPADAPEHQRRFDRKVVVFRLQQ